MAKQNSLTSSKKTCYFCANNIKDFDYKDEILLRKFLSSYGKIVPKKRSGVCSWHQRKLSKAIKRARITGLLPFMTR